MSSTEVGSLEAAALKRKERLAALRASKEKGGKNSSNKDEENLQLPKPIFRSYKPLDENNFSDSVLPDAQPAEVRDKIKDELEKEHEALAVENLDFTNLAPRKPDWDLKRDIAPKLSKLERRTQKAIAEIIRDRLKKEDLANAVNAGASATQQMVLDEDD